VAIECDHPRPRLNLPGYVPRRMAWQVPQYIPDLPPSAARVIREALQGIYQELSRQGQVRNQMPLEGDMYAQPGSVITGVADGQTVTLLPPGALGYTDPVSLLITDVASPMNVVAPDGTITQIGAPGLYDFAPASSTEYQTSPGGTVVAGSVPTDTLLGRDSPGTGAVEFIALTAPLELDGAGNLRIAAAGITAVHLAASVAGDGLTGGAGTPLAVGAGDGIDVEANSVAVDVTDIIDNVTITEVATNNIQRAALTGFAVATAGSNATTSAEPIVTFGASANMSNERVLSNGTGTTVDIGTAGQIQIDIDTPLTDGDKGDITVATNGTVWTVDNDAVSNAKLANMASPRLKGRTTASTGDPEDLTLTNSTSITWNTSTGGAISTERAAVSGSVTLAQNANLAQFSGMAANTTLLPTRTYYNWIAGTNTTVTGTSNATDLLMSVNVDDFPLSGLADQAANTIVANPTGSSAAPTAVAVSADSLLARVGGNLTSHAFATLAGGGLTYSAGVMAVGAGTGITVNANDVAVTIPLTDGDKGDITVATSGTVWTVDADAISNTKLANMAGATVKGRTLNAGTGDPADLTGAEIGQLVRYGTDVEDVSTGTVASFVIANTTTSVRHTPTSALTIQGLAYTGPATPEAGKEVILYCSRTSAFNVTLEHNSASTGDAGYRFFLPGNVNLTLRPGEAVRLRYAFSRWIAGQKSSVADGDYGDITVSAGGATWTIDNDVVSDAKLRNSAALSVIGRSANSTGDPADIAAANDGEVLRRSGTTLGFGTIATAGITDAAVTLAKMANLAAGTVIGRQIDGGTGVPVALTGLEQGENIRFGYIEVNPSGIDVVGTHNDVAIDARTSLVVCFPASAGDVVITGFAQGSSNAGAGFLLKKEGTSGRVLLRDNSGLSTAGNRIWTPGAQDYILAQYNDAVFLRFNNGIWHVDAVARTAYRINSGGSDVTRRRLNVIAGTGISLAISDDSTNEEADLTITGGVVSDGDKGDITVSAGGATWTIDNDVISDAKLRNSAALSVIGRSANSTGDPADIAAASDGEVLRRSGTTLGFGTIATAGITDAAVTLAKMANLAQSTIIGRAEGAGTGVPQALTATQVAAIIDGEAITWTGAHTFTGTAITANVTTADILLGAAVGGIGLFSGQATANVTNGDLVLNSASGIAVNATGTPITSVADGTVRIDSTTEVEINTTTLDINVTTLQLDSASSGVIAATTGTLTLAAGTAVVVASPFQAAALEGTGPAVFSDTVEMNDSTFLDQTFSLRGGQNSATATLNNVALGAVSVLRLSATNFLLSGMAPSVAGGQVVLIFNVNETEDATILVESTNSTLGNRFAGETTSRKVRAGEGVLAWYDGTSEKWRLVGSLLDLAS
jgi:hypothetical protein